MFSDHLQKLDQISGRSLFLAAGGLVIVCQLVAMMLVVDEQVKKAELRDSQLSMQRAAIARCFEGNSRAERQACMLQARHITPGEGQLASNTAAPERGRESASYTDFNRGPASRADVMAVSYPAN